MLRSDVPNVRKVGQRLGSLNPAWMLVFPNLPNLPNLLLRVHASERRRGRTCAYARVQVSRFTLGRLGRLGKASHGAGFRLPNLLRTSVRLGKTMGLHKEGGE